VVGLPGRRSKAANAAAAAATGSWTAALVVGLVLAVEVEDSLFLLCVNVLENLQF
jgi:hypothetical protein